MTLLYRTRQFWSALTAAPREADLELARRTLSPALLHVFAQMQPGEQAHCLAVFHQLYQQGETDRDLWVAALLHDCGKSCHPLRLWERVLVVICRRLLLPKAREWGRAGPSGWKRPFVIAEKHPEWGADLAAVAGASPDAVELIRRHQSKIIQRPDSDRIEKLLYRLQAVDNER